MKVGIAGLGLIGGSLAKAYKRVPGTTVYGQDLDGMIQDFARLAGAIDGPLTPENMGACELVLVAINPEPAARWLEDNAPYLPKGGLVMDCCGTKQNICETGFRLAKEYGFEFAGGHPMAGTHHWGFKYSRANLFDGACMVVVPRTLDDTQLLERIKAAVLPAGFAFISATTAGRHDRLIAFTSQLAHVVSNAYIKSPTALEHRGFSAGSYLDLTRVAWLNPTMWTDLFLENREHLIDELDVLVTSLREYRDALSKGDREALWKLLEEGRIRKEEVDGKR